MVLPRPCRPEMHRARLGIEGYAFAGEGQIGVVLDTTISEELKEEGHLREIISKIQNMRKESGFEVADKINLYVANNDMLINVVNKYSDFIKKETLTQEIIINADVEYRDTIINGEALSMNVKVIK